MSEVTLAILTPLDRLDEQYGHLRVVQPQREAAIEQSLRRLGQLTPLVAVERQERLVVVDGFKRLHAAKKLCFEALEARVLKLTEQASVALMYGLNRDGRGMSDFEQALVVRALCRDYGLAQTEVAELLGHHKSWVCRRLSLVEHLDEQVQQDLRVGLVSLTMARELVRLPRGNQGEVAQSIWRHGLTSRDATRLVTLFEKARDRAGQQALLDRPAEAISRTWGPTVPLHDPRLSAEVNRLRRRLLSVLDGTSRLSVELSSVSFGSWTDADRGVIEPLLAKIHQASMDLADTSGVALKSMEDNDGR